ncbi:MAG TPA: hypothetical protein VKU84_08290 [Stellaceae bacterium]|nr:hypothetical protein [Stellaceae bacterium]
MAPGKNDVGFEAMPQIADLEIAATWDEIELEAALRSHRGDAPIEPSAEPPSCLADALRAVEALKQLPKEERKRRAEELLRSLTSAPADPAPDVEPAPESPSELVAVSAEPAVPTSEEPGSAEPISAAPEIPEDTPAIDVIAEPDAASSEISEATPAAEAASMPPEMAAFDSPAPAEPVVACAAMSEPAAAEASPELHESGEAFVAAPAPEPIAAEAPSAVDDAPVATEPALEAAAERASVAAPIAEPAPGADPAPAPATYPTRPLAPDAIPRFLTTECTALEPEQPDSLIPLRAVAAVGALIGAVLLVYFWSSQEFGLAARPIIGGSETAETHAAAPRIPASLAVRQAFVALPPDFATGPQSVRPYRPAFVGFDFFDDAAPPPAIAVKAAAPAPAQAATPVPEQPSAEETVALPPPASSDVAALIKRGDDLLKAGDVAAARSAYERAAADGNAKAQIGVGQTYDPLVLAKLGARGVRGDPVQAASWYARAGEAGDEEGQQRLHALISGLSDCMLAQGTCASRKP